MEIPSHSAVTRTTVIHVKSDGAAIDNARPEIRASASSGSEASQPENPIAGLLKLPIWHGEIKLIWKTMERRELKEHFVEEEAQEHNAID